MKTIQIVILGSLLIIILIYLISFSEIIEISSIRVPLKTYFEYISTKIFLGGNPDAHYFLEICDLKNGTVVFGVRSGHVFNDVKEVYFDSSGNQVCDNYYVIDCRDACPVNKCLNREKASCEKIAGN